MKCSNWRSSIGALAVGMAAAFSAQADVVTFDDLGPTLFQGTSITSGAFTFTSDGFGFSGVDEAAAFSTFGNAPANASSQFLYALNADGITMERTDGAQFFLESLDASFIAPLGGLGSGIQAGQLWVYGLIGGLIQDFDVFDFSVSDANGDFNFSNFSTANLKGKAFEAVFFLSCIFNSNGFCSFDPLPAGASPQFALDNLQVPAPATLALAITALGLMGASARRRQAPAA